MTSTETSEEQLLHLVFGGELETLEGMTFKDLDEVDLVGVYPNYEAAYAVWKQKACLLYTSPSPRD